MLGHIFFTVPCWVEMIKFVCYSVELRLLCKLPLGYEMKYTPMPKVPTYLKGKIYNHMWMFMHEVHRLAVVTRLPLLLRQTRYV